MIMMIFPTLPQKQQSSALPRRRRRSISTTTATKVLHHAGFFIVVLLIMMMTQPTLTSASDDDNNNNNKQLRFGMTSGGSSFFDPVQEGWEETCQRLGIECEYLRENWTEFNLITTNKTYDRKPCVPQIQYFIDNNFDGISMQCGIDHPVVQEALDAGLHVVSFDVPPPTKYKSYVPYVGTDNRYLGVTMARLLRLLKPEGNTYHVVSFGSIPERYQGFVQEIEKFNNRNDRVHWYKATTNISGLPEGDNLTTGVPLGPWDNGFAEQRLDKIAELNPDAIIFMYQAPMRHPNYTSWVERHRWRNITLIGTQGSNDELQIMARRNVDGLVGQVTYDMGRLSVETLLKIVTDGKDSVPLQTYTKLINYNLVPEQLPDANVDQHLLGNLKYIGFTCFGIVAVCVLFCLWWSIYYRHGIVVRASQPFFLIMTATGVLIMSSTLIPLSFDDDGEYYTSDWSETPRAVGICMSIPWFAFIGFTITFSALFSKTWRVNKFFKSTNTHERIRVTHLDVLAPFIVILSLNIIILICWTIIDPLTYIREFELGTDLYNREIASNGYCRSDHSSAFLIPLALINFCVLIVACYQAYEARHIKSEFAEAKYIGLAVFSQLQAFLTGIPIVAVVRDIPEAYYLVLTFLIFTLSMAILLLIFLPKIVIQKRYANMTPAEQKRAMAVSVRRSAGMATDGSNISGLRREEDGSPLLNQQQQQVTPTLPVQQNQGGIMQDETNTGETQQQKQKQYKEGNEEEVSSTDPSMTDRSQLIPLGSVVERMVDDSDPVVKHSTYVSDELIDA